MEIDRTESLKKIIGFIERGDKVSSTDFILFLNEAIHSIEYYRAETKKWKFLSKLSHVTVVILAIVIAVSFLIFG